MGGFGRAALAAVAFVSVSFSARATEVDSASTMLDAETPEIFLAKATLQQYLSRVVRKDWEGVRRLTHPKALAALDKQKKRGHELNNLAPWADASTRLESFRFLGAREIAPGIIAIATGEDHFQVEEQGVSADDPAVYLLFRKSGSYLIGDKKMGMGVEELSAASIEAGYPGWASDGKPRQQHAEAQARRGPSNRR